MHEKAAFVFWITLILYVLTLVFVSYVGVYLTYVAIPLIVLSGLVMKIAKPSKKYQETSSKIGSVVGETSKAAGALLDDFSSAMSDMTNSLDQFNRKLELVRERTKEQKAEISRLKARKISPEIELKYASDSIEKSRHQSEIDEINKSIRAVEEEIRLIEKQCEIEACQS